MKPKITEEELANCVIETFKEWKWEVYKEVLGPGGRCDIVAKQGQILWAIECKLNFGLAVIEQAYNWRVQNKAHFVSIAVPKQPSGIGKKICKSFGIGILCRYAHEPNIYEATKPLFVRKIKPFKLYKEQKEWGDAGTSNSGYFTPFKKTVAGLISVVKRSPGIEFNVLMKSLNHHYSSLATAKTCLKKFIDTDVIPELEFKTVNKKLCVFLKEKK